MTSTLIKIEKEYDEILKRNKVKSLIKFGDKLWGEARKAGYKAKEMKNCTYLSNNDDYIKAYALYNAYCVIKDDESLECYLNRPTTIMWMNGLEFQKEIINLTIKIVAEARK